MLADQTSHFKHRNLILAKNRTQLFICVNHPLFDIVLKAIGLDVHPQLAYYFCAWKWVCANYRGELLAERKCLHESCIRRSLTVLNFSFSVNGWPYKRHVFSIELALQKF